MHRNHISDHPKNFLGFFLYLNCKILKATAPKWPKKRSSERASDRANERANVRTNARANERTHERTRGARGLGTHISPGGEFCQAEGTLGDWPRTFRRAMMQQKIFVQRKSFLSVIAYDP